MFIPGLKILTGSKWSKEFADPDIRCVLSSGVPTPNRIQVYIHPKEAGRTYIEQDPSVRRNNTVRAKAQLTELRGTYTLSYQENSFYAVDAFTSSFSGL